MNVRSSIKGIGHILAVQSLRGFHLPFASSLRYTLDICVLQKSDFVWEFQAQICTCAQSHALGTCTKSQLEITTKNVISGIVYYSDVILESSQNVSETTPWFNWKCFYDVIPLQCRHMSALTSQFNGN